MTAKIRSILLPFVTVCIIFAVAGAIIAYGRGYRFDLPGKSLKATGLLVVHSDPTGAQILLDGKTKSATPTTMNLPPGWYTMTVTKEGFQPWVAQIKVQGEVVARAEALLLPTNPSLTAITASGVTNPILSPDGSKLAYVIPSPTSTASGDGLATTKPGIWVLELVDKPLGLNRDARQIAKSDVIDLSAATLSWSPDSKQILVTLTTKKTITYYVLDADRLNDAPSAVNDIKTLQNDWKDIKSQRDTEKLATLPEDLVRIATTSTRMMEFSPDETKILYEATASATIPTILKPPLIGSNSTKETRDIAPQNIYVYDVKEDKNYLIGDSKSASLPSPIQWLPTSRHLLLVSKDKIELMDFDGTNRRTAYAGPFWDSFAVPWASGGKLVILTNLNAAASAVNNLYAVNLR